MPFAVTYRAGLCSAASTFAVFAAAIGGVCVDVGRLDPFAAALGGAINTIFGGVFLVFLVPFHFEAQVKEFFNMLQRDVLLSAAFGWHMLRIGDRHGEDSTKTGMAHPVLACEFGGFGNGYVGGETSQTFDSATCQQRQICKSQSQRTVSPEQVLQV